MLVPLAPHALMARSVVLPQDANIEVFIDHGHAVVAADGQPEIEVEEGSAIHVNPGPELQQVHLPDRPGYVTRLHTKLNFGVPLKARSHAERDE